jgi:hypothetical protein
MDVPDVSAAHVQTLFLVVVAEKKVEAFPCPLDCPDPPTTHSDGESGQRLA